MDPVDTLASFLPLLRCRTKLRTTSTSKHSIYQATRSTIRCSQAGRDATSTVAAKAMQAELAHLSRLPTLLILSRLISINSNIVHSQVKDMLSILGSTASTAQDLAYQDTMARLKAMGTLLPLPADLAGHLQDNLAGHLPREALAVPRLIKDGMPILLMAVTADQATLALITSNNIIKRLINKIISSMVSRITKDSNISRVKEEAAGQLDKHHRLDDGKKAPEGHGFSVRAHVGAEGTESNGLRSV